MTNPAHFTIVPGHAEYRPSDQMSLHQAVQLVTDGITCALERHVRDLLIDTTNLTGFPPPSLFDRYFFAKEWAGAARSAVRAAFVARPEMIDAGKFGVVVARNNGFIADVFTSDDEALRWLQSTQ